MKKQVFIISFMFLFTSTSFGQILEKESNMSLGVQNGCETVLEDVTPKDAYKLWKDYFKEYGKIKRNKKADEYYSTGVRIRKIFAVSNIDVYVKFEERGSNTTMSMWVDLGMAFVNSKEYPEEYRGMEDMMNDFRIMAKTYVIEEELKAQEAELDKMKKDLAKLEKDNVNLHDKITDYEEKIREAEENIETNLAEQEEKRIQIDRQVEMLKAIQERLKNTR